MLNWKTNLVSACICLITVSIAAAQQPKEESTGKSVVEIVPIGTAGGPPIRTERSEPATIIRVNNNFYLVDTGIGTVRRLARAGIPVARIKALFITHLHPDHVMDLTALMSDRLFAAGNGAKVGPLEVYGPPGTQALGEIAANYVDFVFRPFFVEGWGAKLQKPYIVFKDVPEGQFFKDDNIAVSAQENTHYDMMSAEEKKTYKTYALRVNTPNGDVLFTGDTGPDSQMHTFGKNADLMISEVTNLQAMEVLLKKMLGGTPAEATLPSFLDHMRHEHLEPKEVAKIAKGANVGAILLNHFGPETRIAGPEIVQKAVKQDYDRDVFISEDLQVYCLTKDSGATSAKVSLCRPTFKP